MFTYENCSQILYLSQFLLNFKERFLLYLGRLDDGLSPRSLGSSHDGRLVDETAQVFFQVSPLSRCFNHHCIIATLARSYTAAP